MAFIKRNLVKIFENENIQPKEFTCFLKNTQFQSENWPLGPSKKAVNCKTKHTNKFPV